MSEIHCFSAASLCDWDSGILAVNLVNLRRTLPVLTTVRLRVLAVSLAPL
jgi:hypothetical protein